MSKMGCIGFLSHTRNVCCLFSGFMFSLGLITLVQEWSTAIPPGQIHSITPRSKGSLDLKYEMGQTIHLHSYGAMLIKANETMRPGVHIEKPPRSFNYFVDHRQVTDSQVLLRETIFSPFVIWMLGGFAISHLGVTLLYPRNPLSSTLHRKIYVWLLEPMRRWLLTVVSFVTVLICFLYGCGFLSRM